MLVTCEICVDWNCADWAGAHDFTGPYDEITSDMCSFNISRGARPADAVYPAATLELLLKNDDGKYFVDTTGVLEGLIRLWLPVRVRATYNAVTYNLYYGYINRITYSPIWHKQSAYFYATDGTDLLAKSIVVQDMDDKSVMTDGEACSLILDAAGWAASRRIIDDDGGDIVNYPDTFTYQKA